MAKEKFRMRQIRINRMGYDSNGTYYGTGPQVYELVDPYNGTGFGAVRLKVGETRQQLAERVDSKITTDSDGNLKLRGW